MYESRLRWREQINVLQYTMFSKSENRSELRGKDERQVREKPHNNQEDFKVFSTLEIVTFRSRDVTCRNRTASLVHYDRKCPDWSAVTGDLDWARQSVEMFRV